MYMTFFHQARDSNVWIYIWFEDRHPEKINETQYHKTFENTSACTISLCGGSKLLLPSNSYRGA